MEIATVLLSKIFKRTKDSKVSSTIENPLFISKLYDMLLKNEQSVSFKTKAFILNEIKGKIRENPMISEYFSEHKGKSVYFLLAEQYLKCGNEGSFKDEVIGFIDEIRANVEVDKETFRFLFEKLADIYRRSVEEFYKRDEEIYVGSDVSVGENNFGGKDSDNNKNLTKNNSNSSNYENKCNDVKDHNIQNSNSSNNNSNNNSACNIINNSSFNSTNYLNYLTKLLTLINALLSKNLIQTKPKCYTICQGIGKIYVDFSRKEVFFDEELALVLSFKPSFDENLECKEECFLVKITFISGKRLRFCWKIVGILK